MLVLEILDKKHHATLFGMMFFLCNKAKKSLNWQ
jgi:hypothetical protein